VGLSLSSFSHGNALTVGVVIFVMKSYSSLFPSYYFRDDDAPVFFKTSSTSILEAIDDDVMVRPCEVSFSTITGSTELVSLLKRAKAISNSFGRKTFEELRGKTNYYEGLGKGCFLNRSAMKLVNLDFVFSLIEPSSASYATSSSLSTSLKINNLNEENATSEVSTIKEKKRPHFSFVDLCGGPGGFIECITLKCRHFGTAVTGFGMTLLIGDEEPGFRGIMKACNWNISHLQDPPYSVILSDKKRVITESKSVSQSEFDEKKGPINTHSPDKEKISSHNKGTENDLSDSMTGVEAKVPEKSEEEKRERRIFDEKSECRIFLVEGSTGTGDICVKENLNSLCTLLQSELPILENSEEMEDMDEKEEMKVDVSEGEKANYSTKREGEKSELKTISTKYVSFVCSDGFDHETEAFRIVLCQVIGMIKTLRVGGNFIMKVFSCTKVLTVFFFCFNRFLCTFIFISYEVLLRSYLCIFCLRIILLTFALKCNFSHF
jgi:FtsJ-like methyltransferase